MIKFHFLVFILASPFSMTHRVFCCTCFVQDLSPGLEKLSRSIKCVFVEYSRTQKGYWCYSPSNRKYFVSADVAFFESIPYFFSQSPVTTSEFILLLPFVSFPVFALVLDVSSLMSPEDTTALPAPQPLKDFRYVYTHRQKVSVSKPVLSDSSSPVEGPRP